MQSGLTQIAHGNSCVVVRCNLLSIPVYIQRIFCHDNLNILPYPAVVWINSGLNCLFLILPGGSSNCSLYLIWLYLQHQIFIIILSHTECEIITGSRHFFDIHLRCRLRQDTIPVHILDPIHRMRLHSIQCKFLCVSNHVLVRIFGLNYNCELFCHYNISTF